MRATKGGWETWSWTGTGTRGRGGVGPQLSPKEFGVRWGHY